jgi:hypothetical protein
MIRLFVLASLGLCTVFLTGCSGGEDRAAPLDVEATAETKAAPSPAEVCQNHEEGCPCDNPGDVTDCGRIKRVEGNYVWCSTGHQTCGDDGQWGQCKGDVDIGAGTTAQ